MVKDLGIRDNSVFSVKLLRESLLERMDRSCPRILRRRNEGIFIPTFVMKSPSNSDNIPQNTTKHSQITLRSGKKLENTDYNSKISITNENKVEEVGTDRRSCELIDILNKLSRKGTDTKKKVSKEERIVEVKMKKDGRFITDPGVTLRMEGQKNLKDVSKSNSAQGVTVNLTSDGSASVEGEATVIIIHDDDEEELENEIMEVTCVSDSQTKNAPESSSNCIDEIDEDLTVLVVADDSEIRRINNKRLGKIDIVVKKPSTKVLVDKSSSKDDKFLTETRGKTNSQVQRNQDKPSEMDDVILDSDDDDDDKGESENEIMEVTYASDSQTKTATDSSSNCVDKIDKDLTVLVVADKSEISRKYNNCRAKIDIVVKKPSTEVVVDKKSSKADIPSSETREKSNSQVQRNQDEPSEMDVIIFDSDDELFVDETESEAINAEEFPFKCRICNFRGLSMDVIKFHMWRDHVKKEVVRCKHCRFYCFSKISMMRHEKICHKLYRCRLCDFVAKDDRRQLHRHIRADHPALKRHTLQRPPDGPSPSSDDGAPAPDHTASFNEVTEKSDPPKAYLDCESCTVAREASKANFDDTNQPEVTHENSTVYNCYDCKFTTYCPLTLATHEKKHRTDCYKCPLCEYKTTIHKEYVKRHILANHTEVSVDEIASTDFRIRKGGIVCDPPVLQSAATVENALQFKCTFCTFATVTKEKLEEHTQHNHPILVEDVPGTLTEVCTTFTEEEPTGPNTSHNKYRCPYGDFGSDNKDDIATHISAAHRSVFVFKIDKVCECPVPEMRRNKRGMWLYPKKKILSEEEKKLACQLCVKVLCCSLELEAHYVRHHSASTLKCPKCSYMTDVHPEFLRRHMIIEHGTAAPMFPK